jgi:hypothetical protein
MEGAALIEEHGMLLQSARGTIPNLPELVVGGPIKGSWWGHPRHDEIFRVLNEAASDANVVRMRLVAGKITLVHRRLWPALVRLADQIDHARLTVLHEEHTGSGVHRMTTEPFPDWVPEDVARAARLLTPQEAIAHLPPRVRRDFAPRGRA